MMRMYRTTAVLGFFLLGLCLRSEAAEQALVQRILEKAFAKAEVTMISGQAANLAEGRTSLSVELESTQEFEHEGVRYFATVVVFNQLQEDISKRFRRGENIDLPEHQNLVLLARITEPFSVSRSIVDVHALGSARHSIAIKDFIGDGTVQIRVTGESVYPLYDPRETVVANRFYLYRFPDLLQILACTSKRAVFGDKGLGPFEEHKLDFVPTKAGKKAFRIRDTKDGVTRLVGRSTNGKYEVGDAPWKRRENKSRKKAVSKLRIRVIDQAGLPVPGVTVSGYIKKVSLLKWSDKNKPFKGSTDKKGEFSANVGDGIGLTIKAEGCYPVKHYWSASDIPDNTILITLEKENEPVRMFGCSRTRRIWNEDQDKLILGVKLIDGRKGKWKQVPTDKLEAADLWIEVLKTGISGEADGWREWTIRLAGKRGWELAPGPLKEDTANGETMREAPASGYQEQLEYQVAKCPQGFYLRLAKGKRYGKIWGFRFEDRSRDEHIRRYMWVRYSVQAEESATRSLNSK